MCTVLQGMCGISGCVRYRRVCAVLKGVFEVWAVLQGVYGIARCVWFCQVCAVLTEGR